MRRQGKVVHRQLGPTSLRVDWRTEKASRIGFLVVLSVFFVCITLTGSCVLQFGLPLFQMRNLRAMRCVLRHERYRQLSNCRHNVDYSTHIARFPCVEVRFCIRVLQLK